MTTAIAIPLDKGGIWLPILTSVIAGFSAAVFTVYEAFGFNSWAYECRDIAGEYIILGRNIESIKRVPRSERDRSGLAYTNDASITFETIRANQPRILARVRKRHEAQKKPSSAHLRIPIEILAKMDQDVVEDSPRAKEEEDEMEKGNMKKEKQDENEAKEGGKGSSEKKATLQDLFVSRLEKEQVQKEENDELVKYEDYIRKQYGALANDIISPRCTAAPTNSNNNNANVRKMVNLRSKGNMLRGSVMLNKKL